MINQWFFTNSPLKCLFVILFIQTNLFSQLNCIKAPLSICVGSCAPIEYIGPNTDLATYNWTISCGTISNPTLKNPHEACFNIVGTCTITLITQEPGSPPDTCEVKVQVNPLPTAQFIIRTDSVCSGNCLGLRVDLTGTPPFIITYRDTTGFYVVRSPGNSTFISICPTVSQFVAIVEVEDANCRNQNLQGFFRLKVFPPFKANVYQQHSMLCASPPAILYRWFECGTNNLVANRSCFPPPKEDCYCGVVFNGFCYDTVCTTFKCNLDCGIDFPKQVFIGDKVKIKYKGNGGPNNKKSWEYTLDNINIQKSTDDSLLLQFNKPGHFLIKLDVQEEICTSSCFDTIWVMARPCACGDFNKNEIKKILSGNNSCCFEIKGEIASADCFTSIKVFTNAGNFSNVQAKTGWSLVGVNTQNFSLQHTSGSLPLGVFNAGDFCIQNASNYTLTVYYYFNKNGVKDSCKYQYHYTCQKGNSNCDSVNAFLELLHTSPPSCCFFLRADNGLANYFNKIIVSINSGSFSNVSPVIGYSISNSTQQSFTINHNSNFIPQGFITPASFCLSNITNPVTVNISFIRNSPNGTDTCNFTYRFNCPDDGLPKEQCCDSTKANLLKFGNQGCCWNFTSYSTKSKCFSKICITSNTGSFIGIVANTGWSSSTIPNGICFTPSGNSVPTGNINPGRFCMSNFNNPLTFTIDYYDNNGQLIPDCEQKIIRECQIPPACSCDSLDNQIFQNSNTLGLCCHNFLGTIPYNKCFTKIGVTTTAGTFTNIIPVTGYSIINNSSSSFSVSHNSGNLPAGNINPVNFCVTGATFYTITVQYFYLDQNGFEQRCVFSSTFDCPKAGPSCSCDSLHTQINQTSTSPGQCCHNFTSTVGTGKCFTKIGVSVNAGSINNIAMGLNYLASNQTSNSFTITHTSGHIPAGTITPANFCVSGASLYTVTVQYFYLDQNGIEQRCIESMLFDCPKSGPICSCDSVSTQINPISINPGLCCYNFTSQVSSSNCFSKIAVTTTAGSFSNISTALGFTSTSQSNSAFAITHSSGFIPAGNITPASFCVTGSTLYTITIQYFYLDQNGQEQRCVKSQTFDCPKENKPCNCDSLLANIIQTNNNPGICCHSVQTFIPNANCIVAMSAQLSSGNFTNVIPANNFTIGNQSPNSFNVGHNSGFLPQGNIQPVTFCVTGSSVYTVLLKFFYFNNGKYDSCQFSKTFDCKPADTSMVCDHDNCSGNLTWQNIANVAGGIVYDIKSYNCKLYAGGQFISFANQSINNIAEWNGTSWSPLSGGGLNGPVRVMAVHNGVLYVGGQFTMAGTVPVNNIAAWNGTSWSNVGGGVTGINPAPFVYALLNTTNGLVVGGQFALTGNNSIVNNIALWNGSWASAFATGIPYPVSTLRIYSGDLYAAGAFFGNPYNCIARWNGSNWSNLTSNGITLVNNILNHGVEASIVWNNELVLGGHYSNADGIPNTQHISKWNGSNFSSLLEGDVPNPTNSVNDFIVFNGSLFAAGEYDQIGTATANVVARSSGTQWNTTGHPNKVTWALESYDSCGMQSCQLYSAGEGFVNRWVCITNTQNDTQSDWVKIYPNPARDYINVLVNATLQNDIVIRVINTNGKVVKNLLVGNSTLIEINTQDIPSGMYNIEISEKNRGSIHRKFIKLD
ncbi:MAG: T9SS type A sorting domain-containing protein [Saprospiraceae bacterium]|nr:T9SS type A sorting domain-containing protein [Saprospiraceae bacterium]